MDRRIENAAELLEKKRILFDRYEQLTDKALLETDIKSMGDYITERGSVATEIDKVDAEIAELLSPWGDRARQVLRCAVEIDEIPPELSPLCSAAEAVMATIRRIRLKDIDIIDSCKNLRDSSIEKIKAGQDIPKINQYLNNLAEHQSNFLGQG